MVATGCRIVRPSAFFFGSWADGTGAGGFPQAGVWGPDVRAGPWRGQTSNSAKKVNGGLRRPEGGSDEAEGARGTATPTPTDALLTVGA
jgi:hypothetical protein